MPRGVYIRTEEYRDKQRHAHKDFKVTWGDKISKGKIGHITTDDARKKMSESHKGKLVGNTNGFKKGHTPWNKENGGYKLSEDTGKKMSLSRRGEKHWNWKGGITPENLRIRHSQEYILWRTAVFMRDDYTCVLCGDDKGGNLEADHIKPFAYYPELRFAIDNGRTLCRPCHQVQPTNGRRKEYGII